MTDAIPPTPDTLLTFPCEYLIKVIGHQTDRFEVTVLTIIRKHIPDLAENAIQTRQSKQGKYLALSITLQVSSKDQLDDLYRELSASPEVLMAL